MIDDSPACFERSDAAADALEAVVRVVDPLYRPAGFLLGYTYLKRGDAQKAERVFGGLVEQIEDRHRQIINAARERWLSDIRWLSLAARLPFVKEWVFFYRDAVRDLYGGSWMLAAEAWAELETAEVEERDSIDDQTPKRVSEVSRSLREAYVRTIATVVGDELAGMAWGTPTSETPGQGNATRDLTRQKLTRQKLEGYFDVAEIHRFCIDATLLGALSHSRAVERGYADFERRDLDPWSDGHERVANLRRNRLAPWFERQLDQLDALLAQEDGQATGGDHVLEDIRKLAQALEHATQGQRPHLFVAILENPKLDSRSAWIATCFMPVLGYVRESRKTLREPLYVESVFCLIQALLMRGDMSSLEGALTRAERLRDRLLASQVEQRHDDLVVLTIGLAVEAEARMAELHVPANGSTYSPRFEFTRLEDQWKSSLERTAKNDRRKPDVRAAANVALGLFARMNRRKAAAIAERLSRTDEEQLVQARYDEIDYYLTALALQSSANAHCYAAECFLEPERNRREYAAFGVTATVGQADVLRAEAEAHIRAALRLMPDDVLANRLLHEIASPLRA